MASVHGLLSSEIDKKADNPEKNLQTLKRLAHTAVADHEDLQRKYDQNQKQYEELKKRLQETECQLRLLQQLYEPVYNEFDKLTTVYSIEKECRSEAERYASKVNKENKKLKRQSQHILMRLGAMEIDLTEESDEGETEVDGRDKVEDQQEHWNHMIEDLETQLADLKSRLWKVEDERDALSKDQLITSQKLETERAAHTQAKAALQYYKNSLKQFRRVSTRAYAEFSDLKDRYDTETVLKSEAEHYASKMLSERDAMARESSVLLASAASDEQLMTALLEIETLTKELALERHQHDKQMTELNETLRACQQQKQILDLEKQLQLSTEETDSLQKQILDLQNWQRTLEQQNTTLTEKLDIAEEKLRPPPPPQAPPLPAGGIFQPLHNIFKRNIKPKKDLKKELSGGMARDPKYEDAIKEMMRRIQSGSSLRPVPKRDSSVSMRESSTSQTNIFANQLSRSTSLTNRAASQPDGCDSQTDKSPRVMNLTLTLSSRPADKSRTEGKEKSAMSDLHQILTNLKKGQLDVSESESHHESVSELARTFNRIRGSQNEPNLSLITEEDERDGVNSPARRLPVTSAGYVVLNSPTTECSRL